MTYGVVFFKDKKDYGRAPGFNDIPSARNFGQSALAANGADCFMICDEATGKKEGELVYRRGANATPT